MRVLVADIEGNGLLFPKRQADGSWSPRVDRIWCIGVGDPLTDEVVLYANHPDYPPLSDAYKRLVEVDRVVFHNGVGYDLHAINKVNGPTMRLEQIWDTLVVSRLLDPQSKEHSLESYGRLFGLYKGDHKDFSKFSHEMATYCKQDVRITMRIYRHLQAILKRHYAEGTDWRQAIELEHRVAFVIALQQAHGFKLNVRKAQELELILREERVAIEGDLQQVFTPVMIPDKGIWDWENRCWKRVEVFTPKRPNKTVGYEAGAPLCKVKQQVFNPGSRQQAVYRLTSMFGWRPTKFTDTGAPQVDDAVLEDLDYPEAEPLKRYFRLTKQLGQIADGDNSWLKLVTPEGYVHGSVNPNGARTGRMSHFAPNMAQVDKKDLRMREVWEPDDGEVEVGCDAEGLELRELGHYLAAYDGGKFACAVVEGKKEDGTDAHSVAMRAIEMNSRDNTKTFEYANIYGAGNEKLGKIYVADAIEAGKPRPKGKLSSIGASARSRFEKGITGLERLVKDIKSRVKNPGYARGHDGRRLHLPAQHSALNTLLQGGGAVVMKKALAIFHFELGVQHGFVEPFTYNPIGFNYLANVHDEVQLTTTPDRAEFMGQQFAEAIRLAGEFFDMRCPLAGAYDIGSNWKETH